MHRFALAFIIPLAALMSQSRADGGLLGRVEGDIYTSPTGAFKVRNPVLPSLGGTIGDTPNLVTFRDAFSTHISVAAFPQDATQRWMYSTTDIKEYLKNFFQQYVLQDFAQNYKNAQLETNARFLPGVLGGSFIAYVLLPGGSMFADRTPVVDPGKPPPVAKRGNMIFVRNGFIFVISIELAERVTEGSTYHKTPDEEDAILRERLVAFANTIEFLPVPAAAAK